MNRKTFYAICGVVAVVLVVALTVSFFASKTEAQPAPVVVQGSRPVTDVACGKTYEVDRLERFYVNGRVAVNFTFGGVHRNFRPQYIWDRNVIGQSTEIRSARRVDRSLPYSLVTFKCLSDTPLEGHEISNVKVMRYELTLRRPLRPQQVIRNGGPARQ